MKILYFIIFNLFIRHIVSECCKRTGWFSCSGNGPCNIFCCNCDHGCKLKSLELLELIKNNQILVLTNKERCSSKCFWDRVSKNSYAWFYDSNLNKCITSGVYQCFSINSFQSKEDCENTCSINKISKN